MPLSVVCESTASAVNAALRDSLGVGGGNNCGSVNAGTQNNHNGSNGSGASSRGNGLANVNSDEDGEADLLQNRLVANAKRVLLSKIEYQEVDNYSHTVLENLKSKYIVIKPNSNNTNNNGTEYQHQNGSATNSNASITTTTTTCKTNYNNTNGHHESSSADTATTRNGIFTKIPTVVHGNGKQQQQQQNKPNPNELPTPKRVLFPRENVRIGWKGVVPGRKWNVGVGMMNVGNTCYLNSTLQALFHVPSLANWLLSDAPHMERCSNNDAGCIICAMSKTLQASQSHQSSIRPYLVYSKLKSICKHMVMGRQEDAHEFLRFLVESMEKSYLTRFRNYKELDQYSKETTPLNQILGGYLKSAVRCLSCGHVSVTFQHFQDLMLDIRKADSIEDALETYFSRERLEDTGYKCEACKKKVSATKQFSLERAPIALCVQLKRFSMLGSKISKQILIKPRLDLTKFASRKTPGEAAITYKLVSLVTHLGVSQHCGHYTAIGLTDSGTYYNFDDSYVRPISVQSVCNTNAYIIFYEMDNPVNLRLSTSTASSTQVSSPQASPKLNGIRVTNNGHVLAISSQRLIGPQLPPDGLASYTKSESPRTPLSNSGNKLLQQKQHLISSLKSNSKTTIQLLKEHPGIAKSKAAALIPHQQQNGILSGMGTSNFQEPGYTKPSMVSTANKGQSVATTNGNNNKSSFNNNNNGNSNKNASYYTDNGGEYDDDEYDDNEESSSSNQRKLNSAYSLPNLSQLSDDIASGKKSTITNGNGISTAQAIIKPQFKSLVPYESATDDEDTSSHNGSHIMSPSNISTTATETTNAKRIDNPLKRRNSTSLSSDDDHNDDNEKKSSSSYGNTKNVAKKSIINGNGRFANSNSSSPTPQLNQQLTTTTSKLNSNNHNKIKTDVIDDIFNTVHKQQPRNANANISNSSVQSSLTKKFKGILHPPIKVTNATATKPNNTKTSEEESSCNDDSDADDNDGNGTSARTVFQSVKRAKIMPPSPPVIKSKVGLWQVTQNDDDEDEKVEDKKTTSVKNLKNPFANYKQTTTGIGSDTAKRVKLNGNGKQDIKQRNGNGYQQNAQSDGTVNELLKQSHRGYGAPVFTWNGTQTEIEKEILAETREQQERDWEHEEENGEQDRGRQRKTGKTAKQSIQDRTPGYNPFQEADNQKRWHKGNGSSNGGGFYHHRFPHAGGHFRQHFHARNKFKFSRYGGGGGAGNNKFQQQRAYQRHMSNVNGGSTAHGRRQDATS